jgi:predicted benzoate:H+ symporter BenE
MICIVVGVFGRMERLSSQVPGQIGLLFQATILINSKGEK